MAKAEIDLLDSISAGAKLLKTNPTCREILRWTLGRCEGSWVELSTLEAEIVELPEYNEACPEPFFVMQWLVDAGCLESIDVDESGSPVDRAAMIESGATEDDIDDIIASYAYRTTEAGSAIDASFAPSARLAALVSEHPEAREAILEVIAFLTSGHTLGEIAVYMKDSLGIDQTDMAKGWANPISIVNKLSDAGVITFVNHVWETTDEGRRLLQEEGK